MRYDERCLRSGTRGLRAAAVSLALALTAACSSGPVSFKRLDLETAYSKLSSNTLSTGAISNESRNTLRRHDLLVTYNEDPERAMAELRAQALVNKPSTAQLATLAETSFEYAMASADRRYFFAAAIYAYALLFPDSPDDDLSAIDPRVRVGVDVYNAALSRGFISEDGEAVELASGRHQLPFGTLSVTFDEESLNWSASRLVDFIPAGELDVVGLRNRYRRWGIGAALAARAVHREDATGGRDYVPPNVRVPVTALLRIDNANKQLAGDHVSASLELHTPTDSEEVGIGRQVLPLEAEPTATLAVALTESRPWQREMARFLGNVLASPDTAVELTALNPPRPNRIPVVFVHGTYSSSSRWANMANDLQADKSIRDRFDLYFFAYDSGNPIVYSGMQLRKKLDELHTTLRTRGVGECAEHILLVAHSQGGLLAKLVVVDSGNAYWNTVSSKPFDQVRISRRNRGLIHDSLFFEARPYVNRVVFMATPHRGSYLASSNLVRRLAARLISVPADLASASADLLQMREDPGVYLNLERLSTSIDSMSPNNKGLQVLAGLPVRKGVALHSIIPVKNEGPLEEGNDGVVAYTSAHIEGVESELVVRSGHSTQDNPHTINEVLRILQLHADSTSCGAYTLGSNGQPW